MIIFESIWTSFETSIVFRGSWGSSELELKIEPPLLAQIRETLCTKLFEFVDGKQV